MKGTAFVFTVKLLCYAAVLCVGATGCRTGNARSTPATVLVYGREISAENHKFRLPANTDLLTVVQHIREAGGFREGVYRVTVSRNVNGEDVTRIIDLADISLGEAELTTFAGGTSIYVVEAPYTGVPKQLKEK
jgi:hypothetical protein